MPNWLRELSEGYRQTEGAGIGSSIEPPTGLHGIANRFMFAARSFSATPLRLGTSRDPYHRFIFYLAEQINPEIPRTFIYRVRELHGASASFPVKILRAVGGWDTSLRAEEDKDVCARIMQKFPGQNFYAVSGAHIVHDPRLSLRQFIYRPYERGVDTLRFYRRNGLVPPVFPFPLAWLACTALSTAYSLPLGAATLVLLPQFLYAWWLIRAVRVRRFSYILFPYIQMAEELATIAGLVRGQLVLRRDRRDGLS
jgi:hypothetical protein